ncbi:acylneuraminate cytidylyltransferase family protein [Eubacterium sp. MSJ-13]|uniref:acylneuraminate cytidylyltransferase family protein n=1 Tax=Eubacterium sp. MSJ-13 TaxID=2841513 RepID=UPI001C11A363|nr:acylneuraminate cytidylyltransferase family protein [Eubacterium sp. MSJ-13]MBU5477774.1 acylneuraminate cytidylyltransferase family protein [Eubacterium sp. MSJ-13]
MEKKYEVLAVIPARSGSKSVVDKNIRLINGKPMLAYSIEHALTAKSIDRVIVSTDSEKYADIARRYGAEVPFIRPAEYATDTALDLDVFRHALSYLRDNENYIPDLVVQLRPTYPIRKIQDIENMIDYLKKHPEADSIRCVAPANEIPYKMWFMNEDNMLEPVMKDIPECYNMPRQQLPKVYYQNACIDVFRTDVVTEKNSMTGDVIAGYVMDENFDIDTEEEFLKASERLLRDS